MKLTFEELCKFSRMSNEEQQKYLKELKQKNKKEKETIVDERKVFPAFNSPI